MLSPKDLLNAADGAENWKQGMDCKVCWFSDTDMQYDEPYYKQQLSEAQIECGWPGIRVAAGRGNTTEHSCRLAINDLYEVYPEYQRDTTTNPKAAAEKFRILARNLEENDVN